jgi:AraC-like DNA-binding protein
MIQSSIKIGGKVIEAERFPETAAMRAVSDGTLRTNYCDNEFLRCRVSEKRIGKYMLLEQKAKCLNDCDFEINRSGVPVLMMSYAKSSDMVRTRARDRYWRSGDVCLSLFPQEDRVVNHCGKGKTFNLFNIVVPEPVVRVLSERYPDTLSVFCNDFERGITQQYTHEGVTASRKLQNIFYAVEHCDELGNYASKYLESKVLDGLSIMINNVNNSDEPLYPVNLVLSEKIHDARDIMAAQYQNPPSLHDLAAMVGTNECTLKSAFKQQFGTTVFQYLFDYRMSLAVNYLRDTSLPVAEIGSLLGYDYPSHFCTAFRRKFGIAPSELRDNN